MEIRTATINDIEHLARIERQSWPPELAADRETLAARIQMYSAGQMVAVIDGDLVGAAYAQRISSDRLSGRVTYDALTDSGRFATTHSDIGDVYQLISVGVLPCAKGQRIGRRLIDRQIEFARSIADVQRIIGFTRPVKFHSSDRPIEEYVQLKNEKGLWADPVLSFQLDSGAAFVSIHRDFRPDDRESRGYGVLIEYAKSPLEPLSDKAL